MIGAKLPGEFELPPECITTFDQLQDVIKTGSFSNGSPLTPQTLSHFVKSAVNIVNMQANIEVENYRKELEQWRLIDERLFRDRGEVLTTFLPLAPVLEIDPAEGLRSYLAEKKKSLTARCHCPELLALDEVQPRERMEMGIDDLLDQHDRRALRGLERFLEPSNTETSKAAETRERASRGAGRFLEPRNQQAPQAMDLSS